MFQTAGSFHGEQIREHGIGTHIQDVMSNGTGSANPDRGTSASQYVSIFWTNSLCVALALFHTLNATHTLSSCTQ